MTGGTEKDGLSVMNTGVFLDTVQHLGPNEQREALGAWAAEGLAENVQRTVGELALACSVLGRHDASDAGLRFYLKVQELIDGVHEAGDFTFTGVTDLKSGLGISGAVKGE